MDQTYQGKLRCGGAEGLVKNPTKVALVSDQGPIGREGAGMGESGRNAARPGGIGRGARLYQAWGTGVALRRGASRAIRHAAPWAIRHRTGVTTRLRRVETVTPPITVSASG